MEIGRSSRRAAGIVLGIVLGRERTQLKGSRVFRSLVLVGSKSRSLGRIGETVAGGSGTVLNPTLGPAAQHRI